VTCERQSVFRFTTWGESHGPAIGCVVDGCPPRIELTEADIQVFMDKRIKSRYRPGHADLTYDAKYGIRDYRGGGRSSARETANRVAAGAIARKVLGDDIKIQGAVIQIGEKIVNGDNWDWDEVNNNPFWCPDAVAAKEWEDYLDSIRKDGNSVGAILEVRASGVPAGWGAPVYGKLDSDLAMGLMSINAAKGVEIGAGFAAAGWNGTDNADEIRMEDGNPLFLSNHSGGILGGISNGDDIVARVAIKPTSSMLTPVQSIDAEGNEIDVRTKGRHDPCVGIRGVPVAEAMLACVLADHKLRHRGQVG